VKHDPTLTRRASPLSAAGVFSPYARDIFAECYPETPHKLRHSLPDHPLLALDALAVLGANLPERSVCYGRGEMRVGATGKRDPNGLTIGETIGSIATSASWAVLRNIEQDLAYRELLHALIDELRPEIERRTGKITKMQGYIYVSSPLAVNPYHFDPEHNIHLQLTGSKVMTQFPAGDPFYAPDRLHEALHTGNDHTLPWRDEFAAGGTEWRLEPGDAVYVPFKAPHHVVIGPAHSISLSIAWCSDWSLDEGDTRALNAQLRRLGLDPRPPERWPASNRAKALAWRAWRHLLYRRR
jgi:hypothetical protein